MTAARTRSGAKAVLNDKMIARAAALERARESFWEYCRLTNPEFYRDTRTHLKQLCETLQAVYEGRIYNADGSICRRLAISEPPRHGKSFTMSLFNMWVLGKSPRTKIINVSYNAILSGRFAKAVRDGISATRVPRSNPWDSTGGSREATNFAKGKVSSVSEEWTVFSDVFPGVEIKDGDGATDMWSLKGSYFTFLAASFGSTVTGIGCDIMVIDDPIKSSYEAYNARILEETWNYWRDTLRSRIEKDGLLIVVMTRWAEGDLIGRFLAAQAEKWHVLNQPACLDEDAGLMLCPEILPYPDYLDIKGNMSRDIFLANYQNTPIDREGRMYLRFSEYTDMPAGGTVIGYVDTADTGADFLCGIFGRLKDGQIYITDIVYTDEPMEKTEILIAQAIYDSGAGETIIESNNGGRGFSRNVRRLLWDKYHTRKARIIDHNQRQNKMARILTEAGYIQENVFYPAGWDRRWPAYSRAMVSFMRKGRNEHDDAPDATTGLAEYAQRGIEGRKTFFSGKGIRI